MDIKYLIKKLKSNALLIISSALIVSILVYLVIKNVDEYYKSESLVYTGIATGYNINVETTNQTRVDYYATSVTFDNVLNIINSREVKTEVCLKLLAQDILSDNVSLEGLSDYDSTDVQNLIIQLNANLKELYKDIPASQLKSNKLYNSEYSNTTIAKLYALLTSGDPFLVDMIYNSKTSYYSIKNISTNLLVKRQGTSDMILLEYTSTDPRKAQETLISVIDVFNKKQTQLKENEALNVVQYFEIEVEKAHNKLKDAEEELKKFNERNGVVNFETQTSFIARQKETLQDQYDQELMAYKAAKQSRTRLEEELKKKNAIPKFDSNLNRLQELHASLSSSRIKYKLQNNTKKVAFLDKQIKDLEDEIKIALTKSVKNKNSTINVSTENLLNEWLQKLIEESDADAHLKVYKQRLAQINAEYNTYAPLGSKLTQLQRQVSIYEQEYLQAVTNLNQSKVKQNNITVSSSVDIVDFPLLPTEPEPSKKAMYVVLSFIVTIFLEIFIFFINVYFDNSIRTPQRAEKMLNMNVIGAIPKTSKKIKKEITDKLVAQILSKLRLIINGNKSVTITVISVFDGEGKTTFINTIKEYLTEEELTNIKFVEHPALVNGELYYENVITSLIQILVVDANRELTEADEYQLQRLNAVTGNQYVVLNNVKKITLDSILGNSIK